ncbi:MAG: NYN domain-containing protein [Polyangiaceae bacterium]|nr:NYN domain-containing protein [Polyangiaceae bacterium]
MTRVITYIDGFNLYFGLRQKQWRKYYWLDLAALSRALLKSGQSLVETNYFTSRIKQSNGNEAEVKRQTTYLDALAARGEVLRHEGHFLIKEGERCRACRAPIVRFEEKMTDVKIATKLLLDAFDDRFDTALVISGDSDLSPPIEAILRRHPSKRIIVVFPPARSSAQLQKVATEAYPIGEANLRASQLPEVVLASNGFKLLRPEHWK